ncbi:Thermophilic serine proteinase precursor [Stieleria maiorica]|uniref:Thermophilic serine proteinase n=2 Tax=Stieleria maiorica TaxID=2795974 RepID=A0A5B9MNV8_9BACT|nr:Thermophilic serine proteinase precursor [Stieleria maiorica]
MTSRERKNSTSNSAPQDVIESNIIESRSAASVVSGRSKKRRSSKPRELRRRQLFESLEQRQLLAGPQLIGIQPNEGELIVDGTVRDTAPRSLTFRFDENQQIDPATLGAIQITRDGPDDQFGTADDVRIQPGSVSLGALADNEVVVRFADSLPDDSYRIDVFGFDAPTSGIVGLRNVQGELLVARDGVGDAEHINFELNLGARVEAVVPQPVVRLDGGTLQQRRDEILVYFNDDELFVENDPATGLPTERSAENPRFYQLLLTEETVRTTDDTIYQPNRVIYDAPTNTARLIFDDDLNLLPGVPLEGGTFRLRIGTAVDQAEDLIIQPTELNVVPRVSSNLGAASDLQVQWVSKVFGEASGNRLIHFTNSGAGGLSVSIDPATDDIVYDFGGTTVTVAQLRNVTQNTPSVDAVVSISFSRGGVAGSGGGLVVPATLANGAPLQLAAVGDTLTTATDIGVFGQSSGQLLSSLLISESIDPLPYGIQLPGAQTDPGRADSNGALAENINDRFGPDSTDGITEIEYNFQGIFSGGVGTGIPAQLNNITAIQKRRVREAISLWSQYLGVQFRETKDSGITFALGTPSELTAAAGTEIRSIPVLDADLRIDPTFAESAMVFSNQAHFDLNYGEDFFRKAMTGIGFLLGLEQNNDVTVQTLMALDPDFLNQTIDPTAFISPIDPFIPVQTSLQQTINPAIDSLTIDDPLPNALEGDEPIFPGRSDILHGQLLHRPDSVDVDLYRFEVALDAGREFGTLTVETFAERLPDSSLLDTSLTLFQDVSASATSNLGLGSAVTVQIDSQLPGDLGNRSRIEFIQSDRVVGDTAVKIGRLTSANGELVENAIRVDLPRRGANVNRVTVGQVINAINNNAFAASLFSVSLVEGDINANVIDSSLGSFSPIRLSGGGTVALTRNDDYFSSDSLMTAKLANGVYYIGVAASGNDQYNPTVAGSGFGGRTQGDYELLVKFEPQVSRNDVIRDLDSDRVGVPGTALDGDLDGKPSGVNNFWFQTRPLDRILNVVSDGSGIVAGQTITIRGADNSVRTFEFVPVGQSAQPGNIAVRFSAVNAIADIAVNLASVISANGGALGVSASPQVDTSDPLAPAQIFLTGERSIQFSPVFQGIEALGRTLFVDKVASVVADGSLDQPFNNIAGAAGLGAFSATLPGDIVRIVGNGGQDNDITTLGDNFAYQVGLTEINGGILPDGRHLDVPRGVTTMIDAGAAFKLRGATLSVGSNNLLSNRNGGALQVLGTPTLLQVSDPSPLGAANFDSGLVDLNASGNVVFTSTRDRSVDFTASGNSPQPAEGNWGGIIFRSDFDRSEGRPNLEDEGIFLQVVNHADIRYGGGSNILINSVQQTVNPIQIVDLRPTVTFNRLTNNASAAMSASPDAFLETRFQEPKFQQAGTFTADYSRIGPDIKQNLVIDNSINGLFIRTITQIGQPARPITVAAHIDDVDIVHYIAENVVIAGQPGGPIQDGFVPNSSSVSLNATGGGSLPVGTFDYRVTFVDRSGFESLASAPTISVTTTASARQVQVLNLPLITSGSDYVTRRLYRLDPVDGAYRLVTELNRSSSSFVDDGSTSGGAALDLSRAGIRGRLNGSLVVDPNTVVKFRGARIELDHGTQLLAEGVSGQRVVFTSALDDRFGAGGSFDTNKDAGTPGGGADPQRGDWSGIYAGPTANVSLDNAIVAYGGGVSLIEGGQSRGFAALELQQATARVTNTRFEYNDNAQDGSGPVGRNGRLAITPATIYARFTQPVIAGNDFVDNHGAIIDIDLASMTDELIVDSGRQTGAIDLLSGFGDNHGPLIRDNTSDSEPGDVDGSRQLNGLRIRGGEITGGTVFDDTDMAHVLYESVIVGNLVSTAGLTLKSRPDESLVVKFAGRGTPNSATAGTGITATGSTADIDDRIGGTVHIIGLPGAPVVLTSLKDDSVGAGRRSDGTAQTDTNGDGFGSRPDSNDWRSVLLDGFSNDRNVAVLLEEELTTTAPPGRNASVQNAQILGDLADRLTASDDQLRLGFEVDGYISAPGDIDTYGFTASGGTQIWIDVDQTSLGLDTMIELVDDHGNVIARSDNSFQEVEDPSQLDLLAPGVLAGGLGNQDNPQIKRWENGTYYDVGSTNLSDAGLRVTLPGVVGTRSDYYIRIRGASVDPDDIAGGSSSGSYRFQLRLQEDQEFPGSVVRHADIRYANHGIHVQALPGSSPLLGEAQENEAADPYSQAARDEIDLSTGGLPIAGGYGIDGEPRYGTDLYASNDQINGGFYGPQDLLNPTVLNSRPQNLGDLIETKTGTISVGGQLADVSDVDFYQLDIDRDGSLTDLRRSTTFDIDYAAGFDRPDTNLSVFYSPTGNPNQARLVLFGENSNVLDDQSSPLSTELIGELLERGSISESDPLIGPVALPAGSYFIAVTESGRVPTELIDNPRVRRTPVDSGVRIFDDHIEVIGGATAEAPRELEFVATASGGWSITTNRDVDLGHDRPRTLSTLTSDDGAETVPAVPTIPVTGFNTVFNSDFSMTNSDDGTNSGDPVVGIEADDFVADRIVLAFQPGVSVVQRNQILNQNGLELSKEFDSIDAIVVKTQPGADIPAEVSRLSQLPEVKYAEPDFLYTTSLVPNDPLYPSMWGLDNTGQTGGTIDADIDAPEAWDITPGNAQTVVAVIDSGIDLTHPDLVDNLWVNPGEIPGDGIDNDNNGYIDDINGLDPFDGDSVPQDTVGHGTHVSGTIAAVGNNAIGVTGVNWNAKIMTLRVGDVNGIPNTAVIEALDYVTMMKRDFGINVVVTNNSYGGFFPSFAMRDAILVNTNEGIPFVAAAGNSGLNNDQFPAYPASFDLPGIISVAATDDNDDLAVFSNFGLGSVDLAAPGVDILSTTLGGGYGLNSGTSMASPHVAGAVSILAGFQPSATVTDLKTAIMQGADPLSNLTGTSVSGARLNLFGALANLPSGSVGNESYHFDRSEAVGRMTSNAFDLTGYSAADLPRFYFDYFVDRAAADDISVQAFSNEQSTPVELDVDLDDPALAGQWRQAVLSLEQFAGDTGIVIEFIYNTDLNDTAEGLYLDNFIVGFAERGEMVSDALFGEADFTTTFTGTPGEYQLEIRPGTTYTQSIQGGILVERALEAAPKLIDPVYLSVQAGRAIVPYDTFTIDVLNTVTGVDETLTFQYQPVETARQDASLVDPNAVPVPFARNDTQTGIVNRVVIAIRGLTDYAFFRVNAENIELTESFDTNDRHGDDLTLIAPAGSQLSEGDTFRLGDGSRTRTFEFSTDSVVSFGNIRVPFSPGDSAAQVARRIIEVINSGVVQGSLQLRASTVSGEWDFNNPTAPDPVPTDARIALHGSAAGNFHAVQGISDAPQPGTPLPVGDDGSLILSAIFRDSVGDRNTVRTQGQVIVENNQITEVHAIGIWSDPGFRGTDPEDNRSPDFVPAPTGNNFIDMPPVGNTQLGGVINFPELNDSVPGGLAPGLVAQNNIIDQAGYTGIKVDGETRPLVIEWNNIIWTYLSGGTEMPNRGDIMVPDGFTFAIDAGGTRVVFEFEDIGGTPVNFGGSGAAGGDGFVDGHVPVYYRLGGGPTYNPALPDPVRNVGYTSHEMMMAIYEAIQGSILVTNDLVELVRPTLGPSLTTFDAPLVQAEDLDTLLRPQIIDPNYLDFFTPAIYLEGATAIYTSAAFTKQNRPIMLNLERSSFTGPLEIDTIFNFQTGETSNTAAAMMPIAEAPQPLAKLINNTIRGSDGTEGAILEDGSLSPAVGAATDEPNDVIANAVDTKLEVSHRGGFFSDGTIGDNNNFLTADQDVDFFKVELAVGDRLIVDIDTLVDGPATQLRVFDATGTQVAIGENGALATHLKPGSTVEFPLTDNANARDGFIDFTALEKGTYYVGVSSAGNETYEAKSLTERTTGLGGTGDYSLGIDVLAPKSFVFSLDNHPIGPFGNEDISGNINGTQGEGGPAGAGSLVGTTFTISQIPDYQVPTRTGDAYAGVVPDGNRVTFEFTNGVNSIVLNNGNINVPIFSTSFLGAGGFRVPDIMRSIANAINGYLNNPAMPNHEVGNGPDGRDGPVTRVEAQALGGTYGDNIGINNMIRQSGCDLFLNIDACPYGIFGSIDFTTGFGHDRRESGSLDIVPNGTFTDSRGTNELYVLIDNAAKIELSPEARAAGLKLGPDNSRLANGDLRNSEFATESDQLLAEQGIYVGSGVSASILNNVVVNTHQSMVKEESSVFGFGGRIDAQNPDISIKQGNVVAAGNAFQYDDYRNTQMRSDISWWVGVGGTVNRNQSLDTSLSTDLRTGPSNIAGGNSDFNFVVQQPGTPGQTPGNFITFIGDDVLEDGAAGRFTPALNSSIIDSAVDSLDPNVDLFTLNSLLGIPTRSINAPKRDFSGQLRADEPTQAPPGGIGADVFKDRGALDRADFVGPTATLDSPQDNDFAGRDTDPATSFVNRKTGVFTEFRILVQDLGDDSNPFVGSGIDNDTIVVSPIDGLRNPGANLTLFENGNLLVEGIDYTFSFDETGGVITLKPLAGVWRNDRSYRIELNNRDRTVLIAPDSSSVTDGDQLSVVDSNGGTVIFEFESGYLMHLPEALTLEVPRQGTNQGGLIDGGVFSIGDGVNPDIIFEFDSNGTTVPGSVPVTLPATATPVDETQRQLFLESIAENIRVAIQGVIDNPGLLLDVDVRTDGSKVILSSEPGTRVDVSTSGLVAAARTLGLQVPLAGADVGGVIVGETFVVDDGNTTQTFQFVDATNPAPAGVVGVDISPVTGNTPLNSNEVAAAILASINASSLSLTPEIIGRTVYLDLPVDGSADVPSGRLRVIGISRTAGDGDLIRITPTDGSPQVVFEINRTDERQGGLIVDDGVDPNSPTNIPINITRDVTADQLAGIIEAAIENELGANPIAGLPISDIRAVGQGILRIGGEEGLGLAVTGNSLEVTGTPSVTGASTLEVFGPLLMEVPFTAPNDGDTFTVVDANGAIVPFEFDSNSILLDPTAQRIVFTRFDDQVAVATAITTAINAAGIGVTATYLGGGDISLGKIAQSRVDTSTSALTTRRGIVADGEFITITQGSVSVRYEFESISNGGGVRSGAIPVPFQPGSTTLDVANSLAAAISSNRGGLVFTDDPAVTPQGLVALNDVPGTLIDVATAPSLILGGVPGGAVAVNFSPADSKFDINQALLNAINSIGSGSTLFATDRGGATLFVENGRLFEGVLDSYFLPAIKDVSGNTLMPNREDNTTQFTLLLPTVALDYGDAPDPRDLIPGRYASLLLNDGARHVVTPDLKLGSRVDSEPDAQVTGNADGDDLVVSISTFPVNGGLFGALKGNGFAEIQVLSSVDPLTRDGDMVTLTLADRTVTIEFDIDGIFAEQNFAITPTDPTSTASIAEAVAAAIRQTGLDAGELEVIGDRVIVYSDDEDGVSFASEFNPNGNLSKGIPTPISVTVTGGGHLQGWIDFNADGDWDDPGEQIIGASTPGSVFSDIGSPVTRVFNVTVPPFASPPPESVTTYARFRVSREGGLQPDGLALSGEVEDYSVLLVPGSAPTIPAAQRNPIYTAQEDGSLLVLDEDGSSTTTPTDDGLLRGIFDPDGDPVAIYRGDVGVRDLFTDSGEKAGELDLAANGTFTFIPEPDFNGQVSFTALVTDVKPGAPGTELVNPNPLTVTIDVAAVNDKPFATVSDVTTNVTIDEDQVTIFTAEDLIDPFYLPGPANESDQVLIFQSVSSPVFGDSVSSLGGILEILADGRSVRYTPPQDYNGTAPDTFNFVVADVLQGSLITQSADKPGTVSITINAVNDPPIANPDFFLDAQEDTNYSIAIRGGGSIVGILDNDSAGPANEVPPLGNQTITLPLDQFNGGLSTQRGGVVRHVNGQLVYTPPGLYSGPDGFTYRIVDSEGAEAFGAVTIRVGGENNTPRFEGINGEKDLNGNPVDTITLAESKPNDATEVYVLDTWFSDPENDNLAYSVTSSNSQVVAAAVDNGSLTLTQTAYAFGNVLLTIQVSDLDENNQPKSTITETVTISIANENDPPELLDDLGTVTAMEGDQVTLQLTRPTRDGVGAFFDPDGDTLTYRVVRIGDTRYTTDPPAEPHPLIDTISTAGGQLTINLDSDASGFVEIEIEAADSESLIRDVLTLNVLPVPDAPVATDDAYNVAIGATLRVLNPNNGLLRNDFDADNDPITVDLATVTQPSRGTLEINADGTFVYTSIGGTIGQTDSFTYRVMDHPASGSSRFSEFRTVTLTLSQSQYQNPIAGRAADVTADGFVTPIDALRIINLLARRNPPTGALPVSEIGTAPPDFYDVDGNGEISPNDALVVINTLALMQNAGGEGEGLAGGASATAFAAPSSDFLPTADRVAAPIVPQTEPAMTVTESTDALLTAGLQIESVNLDAAGNALADHTAGETDESSVDDALADWFAELESPLDP